MTADERGADEDDLDVFRPERPLPLSAEAAQRLFAEAGPDHPDPATDPDPAPGDAQVLPDPEFERRAPSASPDGSTPWAQSSPHDRTVPARPLGLLVGTAILAACGLLLFAVVREVPDSVSSESTATAPAPGSELPALPRIPADTASPSSAGARAEAKAPLETGATRISATTPDHPATGSKQGEAGTATSSGTSSKQPTSQPQPDTTRWSVRSVNYPDRYWTYRDGAGRLDPVSGSSSASTRKQATFTVVAGLADSSCFSFKVSGGDYLRHYDFRIRADAYDGTRQFREDATFCRHRGGSWDSVSFESYNYPGRYLRHRDFKLWIDPYENSSLYRDDISFQVTAPLY
ncbi:AbfB domain-containing protein [Streptomyces sp. NPDC059373]